MCLYIRWYYFSNEEYSVSELQTVAQLVQMAVLIFFARHALDKDKGKMTKQINMAAHVMWLLHFVLKVKANNLSME